MFKTQVQDQINTCQVRGQTTCNCGWQLSSLDNKPYSLNHDELEWYYALGSWNYRVTGYRDTNSQWHFTLDVFKYYKWGNPYGGPHKANLCVLHIHFPCIEQNDVAQLNADDLAQNFDVWGIDNLAGNTA